MKFNEEFRIYSVHVISDDGTMRLFHRTKHEAKTAVQHWLPSWTTKACCVINTRTWSAKLWKKQKNGEVTTKTLLR